MDAGLARRVRRRLGPLQGVLPERELADGPVVHGDAHLAHVLWQDGHPTALLDFEWARTGPADLELEAACRDDPDIEAGSRDGPCDARGVPVLAGLRAGYPGLFGRPDGTERLWLYELSHQVRQLSAPDVTAVDASRLRRLAILADRPRVRITPDR